MLYYSSSKIRSLLVAVQLHTCVRLFVKPHGLQRTRPPCPSPSSEVCPSSCPLHWWCHPAISFSDTLFSLCPQSFPASGIFPVSRLFTSHDQNTGASASASVLPVNILGWFDLLAFQGTLESLLQHHSSKVSILWLSAFFTLQLLQPYLTTGEDHSLDYMNLCQQNNVLAFQHTV